MPIPFIIGAVAVGIGSVVGAAAKSVNNDYQAELNSLHDKMENIADRTEKKFQKAKRETEYKLDRLTFLKQTVYEKSFKSFVDSFSKIKNVEITENQEFKDSLGMIKDVVIDYYTNTTAREIESENTAALKGAVLGGLFGGTYLVSGVIKGVKLQYAIEEAEAEYAKLKVEAEKVNRKTTKLSAIGKRADELYEVTSTLDHLFNLAIKEMKATIQRAGTNYRDYNQKEREQLFITVQFAEAIKKLINVPIVTKSQGVSKESGTLLSTTKKLIEERS